MDKSRLLDTRTFSSKYDEAFEFTDSQWRVLWVMKIKCIFQRIHSLYAISLFFFVFRRNKVLQISNGIQYPGGMRWELVACLVCAWILVYFAIWKSIKSSAKVAQGRHLKKTFCKSFLIFAGSICHGHTSIRVNYHLPWTSTNFRRSWARTQIFLSTEMGTTGEC